MNVSEAPALTKRASVILLRVIVIGLPTGQSLYAVMLYVLISVAGAIVDEDTDCEADAEPDGSVTEDAVITGDTPEDEEIDKIELALDCDVLEATDRDSCVVELNGDEDDEDAVVAMVAKFVRGGGGIEVDEEAKVDADVTAF